MKKFQGHGANTKITTNLLYLTRGQLGFDHSCENAILLSDRKTHPKFQMRMKSALPTSVSLWTTGVDLKLFIEAVCDNYTVLSRFSNCFILTLPAAPPI
jgi:hypothetical protein